jgi:hypothetical protein
MPRAFTALRSKMADNQANGARLGRVRPQRCATGWLYT